MGKVYIAGFILCVLAIGGKPGDRFPQTEITNGLVHARLYLPDVKDGYYRGSRFDWSGVMPELEYQGHTYFGQWFDKYSPTLHDAIMGPVEDFSPVGYSEANTGDGFLKVGIGMVVKPKEPAYSFAAYYPLINAGKWKVKKSNTQVEFVHTLTDKEYAYKYSKTVALIKGKPEMVLIHSLENTGKKTIETNVYDHNFFVMDKQPTGKDFTITFPFNLEGEASGNAGFGKIQRNQVTFLREASDNEYFYYVSPKGFEDSIKTYDIKIENHATGAAVRITCDQPLSKLACWSAKKTLCPEPYIHIKVDPGEKFNWNISYQFYICGITQ